jgi:quinol monooxygenase YgiN
LKRRCQCRCIRLVDIEVKANGVAKVKDAIQDFVAYVQANEPGTKMYLAWQQTDDATHFLHLFIFEDEAAQVRHGESEAVKRFRRDLLSRTGGRRGRVHRLRDGRGQALTQAKRTRIPRTGLVAKGIQPPPDGKARGLPLRRLTGLIRSVRVYEVRAPVSFKRSSSSLTGACSRYRRL